MVKRGVPKLIRIEGASVVASLASIERGTGIERSYLSRIFSGQRTPGVWACAKIAAYLGVSVDRLLAHLAGLRREEAA